MLTSFLLSIWSH
ncbi:unnamed protein product [Acanthoscelides obtectus]|uniref:Uncharacterized protein n=1 Tax=Acanthoscelides obtectus TaxID=200917 RepID=A0A9P0PCN7_ACAOB|nr:unnamed protein product [Acanthoscelides obtectus]